MKRRKASKGLLATATALLLVVAACAPDNGDDPDSEPSEPEGVESEVDEGDDPAAAPEGGTLVVVQDIDFLEWDPAQITDAGYWTLHQLYDVPVRLGEGREPEARLATDWEQSDDAREFTLNLRDDVMFHDGSPFTAEDLVATLEHLQDDERAANLQFLALNVTDYEIHSDYEVTLISENPFPHIYDLLDLMFIAKIQDQDAMQTEPIGTGPFYRSAWQPGDSAVFTANEEYWDGRPSLDEIRVRVIPDEQAALAALEAGDVDVYDNVPLRDLDRLQNRDDIETDALSQPALLSHVMMTTDREPFDDVRVRQAIRYALDRERISQAHFGDSQWARCLPWGDDSPAYDEDLVRNCPQDLERASELLAEAGYGEGDGLVPLEFDLLARPDTAASVAPILQEDLRQIGVTVNINMMESGEASPLIRGGDFQAAAHQMARMNRDPATMFQAARPMFPGGANNPRYENPEYDALVERALVVADLDERREIFMEFNELLAEDVWTAPVMGIPRYTGWRSTVSGLTANADGMPILQNVTLSTD